MYSSLSKQSGHAAILFTLLVPALFGLFSLATDGAKMLQDKARLQDGLEAASLAVAARNDDNVDDGSGQGSAVNQAIANAYIGQYMTNMDEVDSLNIQKLNCEQIADCVAGLAVGDARFFEYRVTATTAHTGFFSGNLDSFDGSYDVSGQSNARKYQNSAVDVVFVSDFSGSMGNGWSGGSQDKYLDLVDVIESVTDELQKFNDLVNADDNTVSFVGFNNFVRLVNGDGAGGTCFVDQLVYSSGNIDYSDTVNAVFTEKTGCVTSGTYNAVIEDILPTSNFTPFNTKIATFSPNGYTSSAQGLIRGAQLANLGANPRRLIIILSDGNDVGSTNGVTHKTISSTLYGGTYQMCDEIRSHLDGLTADNGDPVSSRIAVIGFDYNVSGNAGLQNCAGVENVFKAENKNEILNKILELISEEIGHLK
ncbi:membrane associated secretion system protein [Vibrio ichthyoenteri ATCC 700023]|uniref:Membrane associated secretion system protein n=1 Tax=Vibrio ichthyoenteri ATCC 700023 TaxID=870968 RepID=F9RWZ1_9VIBR|nr:TadE/TadG family type IV pilus assembly protein [Vibrio ichthyoenteri]EGU48905.1 membrane associated secretion system protein [Vibrio ichthyoenteri ATCC 700023]